MIVEDGVRVSYIKGGKRNRHLVIICVVIGAILIAGVALSLLYLKTDGPNKKITDDYVAAANPTDPANFVVSGEYEVGQKKLDDNLASATDNASKSAIYINKSSIALNMGKHDDAYEFARRAEELTPSVSSAKLMASALAKKGDKEAAITNYRIAISRITGDSELDDLEKSGIQAKIDRL